MFKTLITESGAPVKHCGVIKSTPASTWFIDDRLSVEEPLEIVVGYGRVGERKRKKLAVAMRTPGADEDLISGFLFTEGIIQNKEQALSYRIFEITEEQYVQTILVELHPGVLFDPDQIEPHFFTNSACGLCNRSSWQATEAGYPVRSSYPVVRADFFYGLPDKLRSRQTIFEATGGIHGCGIFTLDGRLILWSEDVGRHNALDKLIGQALKKGLLPLSDYVLLLSGRISYELVQKAYSAGVPIIAAVGAPSSMAVQSASEREMTLIGFLKNQSFNIYCGANRVTGLSEEK